MFTNKYNQQLNLLMLHLLKKEQMLTQHLEQALKLVTNKLLLLKKKEKFSLKKHKLIQQNLIKQEKQSKIAQTNKKNKHLKHVLVLMKKHLVQLTEH